VLVLAAALPLVTSYLSPTVIGLGIAWTLLAQAYVSGARVESFSLTADMMYVATNAPRILRAIFELCLR
jgi:hypothetical protein